MLTIQACKDIDPTLVGLSDEQITEIRDALYAVGKIALESVVSKNPKWVLHSVDNSSTIKP